MKLPENSANINVLKKEYIEYSNEINKLTREIREVNETIEYYFMTEEPKILSKEYKHEEPMKKKKKKKVVEPKPNKPKEVEPKPDKDTFKKGDDVKWMSGNKELTGKIDNITSKSYIICCKPGGKMYRVKKELVSLNEEEPVEEEEPEEEPVEEEEPEEEPVEEEEPPVEEEPVEITTGSKVKWTKDGKEFNGDVENITSKSYIICCKPDGKKYRVPKKLVSLV